MIHSVSDSSCNSYNPDFPDALDSKGIDDVVRFVDENDLDILHVGVHRHMVFGDVGVHDTPKFMIDQRLFVESHADAPHNAAHDLTGSRFRIDDTPGRDCINDARDTDYAKLLIHLHSAKIAECVLRACFVSSLNSADFSLLIRSTPPVRMTFSIDPARPVFCLATIMPSASATSSTCRSASGESGIFCARPSSSLRTSSAVAAMACATEAAVHDPPSTIECGKVESPSFTVTLSMGTPSMSAATCAMTVYVPVPISDVAQDTSA